ncbi:hypothetical protein KIPB_007944 [Kipferlia bialata]|uniref:Amino acid transporter transmembrane domain-containing protein n=1 Tax=Kipferlia bialata TaxID=797122 RepID=A0A9K3CZB9_9EUKA|nr:hypothetical protein KIPB_007944 [Kipferlia bialata]|eukprot:g7944.t1
MEGATVTYVPAGRAQGTLDSYGIHSCSISDEESDHESDQWDGRQTQEKASTVPRSTFNMSNSMLGAGILALAGGLAQSGVFLGLFLMAFCVILHRTALRILVQMTHVTGCNTYKDLVRVLVGPKMAIVLSVCGIALYFGPCCAYYMVAGDYLSQIVPSISVLAARVIMSLPMLGLSLLPSLERLSIVSLLAILASLCSTVFVTGAFVVTAIKGELHPVWLPENPATAIGNAFSLMSGAFGGEFIIIILFANLGGSPSARLRQIRQVINYALGSVAILNTFMAVSGSMMFGEDTRDNLLMNFPPTNIVCNIVKLLTLVVLTCSYPLMMTVTAVSIGELKGSQFGPRQRIACMVLMWSLVVVIGSFAGSIATVLSVTYATGGSMIYFVLPGIMAFRAPRKDTPVLGEVEQKREGETEEEREKRLDEATRADRTGTSSLLAVVGMVSDADVVLGSRRDSAHSEGRASFSELSDVVRDRVHSMWAPRPSLDPKRSRWTKSDRPGSRSGSGEMWDALESRSRSNSIHGMSPSVSIADLVEREASHLTPTGRSRASSLGAREVPLPWGAEGAISTEGEGGAQGDGESGGLSAANHDLISRALAQEVVRPDSLCQTDITEDEEGEDADATPETVCPDLPWRFSPTAVLLIVVGCLNATLKLRTFF